MRTSTVKNVSMMMDHWQQQHSGAQEFVVQLGGDDDMLRLTLSVFGESIFGRPMDVFASGDHTKARLVVLILL